MAIQVNLYGDLREKVQQQFNDNSYLIRLNFEDKEIKTVLDIFKKINLEETEISHIFVNGKYSGAGKEVKDGDRVGIFPKKMGLMFVEISKNNSIFITIKFFADLRKYGPNKSLIDLPEGSTVRSIIRRYRLPKEKRKLIILVNGRPCYDKNLILKDGDTIAFFPPLAGG